MNAITENSKSYYPHQENREYIYIIRIGEPAERLFKIGTTNNINRRMKEHKRAYKKDIEILGVIALTSKYTTLRVESKMIEKWKTFENWVYKRNDRFIIPEDVKQITITVRKDYIFNI